MKATVYIYDGPTDSYGRDRLKLEFTNDDTWQMLDRVNGTVRQGSTVVRCDQDSLHRLLSRSRNIGCMDEDEYKRWNNNRLLGKYPNAPTLAQTNGPGSNTLTDTSELAALGVRIQKH